MDMMGKGFALVLLIAFVATASCAIDTESDFNESYGAGSDDMLMQKKAKSQNAQIVQNIVRLQAFARSAHDMVEQMKYAHSSMVKSALVDLLLDVGKQNKKGNVVTHFADAYARAKTKYHTGIGTYVLEALHRSIASGAGAIVLTQRNGVTVAGIKHEALGFETRPDYIRNLDVNLSRFLKNKAAIRFKGAIKAAKLACLMRAKQTHYKAAYQQVAAKWSKARKAIIKKINKGAFKAEVKKWKSTNKIIPQVASGVSGARDALRNSAGKIQTMMKRSDLGNAAKTKAVTWAQTKGGCESLESILRSVK